MQDHNAQKRVVFETRKKLNSWYVFYVSKQIIDYIREAQTKK